nr:TrkH family potassium uptake protein [Lachnospiraceae bacterium]
MNTSIIRYILGKVLMIEFALMLCPSIVAVIYHELKIGLIYALVGSGSLCLGYILSIKKPSSRTFYLKEGCVVTALSWVVLSMVGALPFYLTKEIPMYIDALFETVSGFTTTGSSILTDIESLSHASLFWRSLTNWIGGMGVLVFLLAVVSMNGGASINLMKAESPGPSVGKLVPKVANTARKLYLIYIILSVLLFVLLIFGGMPVYDAICASFSTAGTGGFSIYNASMANQTIYTKIIISIFMLLFGINFNFYYFIGSKNIKKAFKMEELRVYLLLVVLAVVGIFISLHSNLKNILDTFVDSLFQVASIISTTGISTVDYDKWPMFALMIIVILTFSGACAGSTAGGIKISRIIILLKTIKKEILSYIHPKSIRKISMDGKAIEHEVIRSVNVFIITYMAVLFVSCMFVSIDSHDFTTTFTSVLTCLSNVG